MTYIPKSLKGYFATMQALSKINIPSQEVNMPLTIRKGPQARSIRCVIYGPEGIGKSTLASQFPDAVFIDFEQGTDTMDVARFENPTHFDGLILLLKNIAQEDVCKTVVIDTADKLESLITDHICEVNDWKNIEDPGYGKGYTYLAQKWLEVLKACDDVVDSGKNIVIVAHAQMRKFEQPDEMGAYDRWELKLSKKTAPLIKEWADMVLFMNYKNSIVEDPKTKSKKAVGGKRVMYATHSPTYDAKNRFGLPDSMDADFSEIAHIFSGIPVKKSKKTEIHDQADSIEGFEPWLIHFLSVQDPTLAANNIDELEPTAVEFVHKNITKLINKFKEEQTNE
jgi:GTPase SAR1 family protein